MVEVRGVWCAMSGVVCESGGGGFLRESELWAVLGRCGRRGAPANCAELL